MVWRILIWLVKRMKGMIIVSVLDGGISFGNKNEEGLDFFGGWGGERGGKRGIYNRIMGHIILRRIWMFGL